MAAPATAIAKMHPRAPRLAFDEACRIE